MKNVLISIIIPCYNSEKWIVDTLKSLIYKEYEEYEIVFINDGSNDKSLIKAKEFFLTTKLNYRIINQQNSGVSIARNEGIKNARGEYVYFLDSDDRVCNNFFDIVFENIKNKKSDMIFFDYDIVDGDKVVRLFHATDFDDEKQMMNFGLTLKKMGVDDALRKAGAKDGDVILIEDYRLEFVES